jgi:hypothetical protein
MLSPVSPAKDHQHEWYHIQPVQQSAASRTKIYLEMQNPETRLEWDATKVRELCREARTVILCGRWQYKKRRNILLTAVSFAETRGRLDIYLSCRVARKLAGCTKTTANRGLHWLDDNEWLYHLPVNRGMLDAFT